MTNTLQINLIKDVKALDKAIVALGKTEKESEVLIHSLACSVLYHVDQHQDITVATKCVNSFKDNLSNSRYKTGLVRWFEAFGKLRYDTKTKAFRLVKGKETRLEEAMKIPYWLFAPEKIMPKVSLVSGLKSVLTLAEKRLKSIESESDEDILEEMMEKTDINMELYNAVNAIFLKYQNKKVA